MVNLSIVISQFTRGYQSADSPSLSDWQVNMEVKFSIPPYVSLLARSVATLEGVALQGDPGYLCKCWKGAGDAAGAIAAT